MTIETGATDLQAVEQLKSARERILAELRKVIVGQDQVVEQLLTALFANGHVLLVGVPGLAKTLLISSLARVLDLKFSRIQFTPDLMPSDITGTDIIEEDQATGKRSFRFIQGPVFANIVLADEINRTPPKTQAALLQAMQETEVTVGRQTFPLPQPFFVVATQNPIEMEGTYPLPEAQVDRFMFSLRVAYPSIEEESRIIKGTTGTAVARAAAALGAEEVVRLQEYVRGVPIADSVVNYAARLVAATRPGCGGPADLHKYIAYGASPRASQCLVLGSKARAILAGRFHVDFADLKALAAPVLRHRLVLNFHARADKIDADTLIERFLAAVPQEA
jgi:MoxR-like ATPase